MSNRKTTLFYVVLVAVASMAIGMVIASRMDLSPASSAQTMSAPAMNSTPITGKIDADTFRTIAKAASPFVVNIRTEQRQRTQELSEFFGGDEFFRRFFGDQDPPQQRRAPRENITEGAGTGFIIDASGLILTNSHVVEGATRIQVGLFGSGEGEYLDAKVVGRDKLTDSALIELTQKPSRDLVVARFGDSDQIQPGDWVMAIGNPFNLGHTVTVGILSAKGRPFDPVPGREQPMLQTDAAINPGNSGGPLLNIRGEVVGINTAIYTGRQQGNLGIGFAVPINAVRELLPQLRAGKVTRGRIGVSLARQVQKDVLEQLGAKDGRGALVQQVESGGPAQKAGLQPGDVIVEFNGKPVQNNDELVNQVVRTTPGTSVPIKVLRGGEARSMSVTVAELDLETEGGGQADEEGEGNTATGFGMTLQDVTPEIARQLRAPTGTAGAVVVEVEPRSPAARAFLQPRDIILEVNRKAVANASEASRELQKVRSGQIATLLVLRGGQEVFLTVRKE
jgi:serine protease Do